MERDADAPRVEDEVTEDRAPSELIRCRVCYHAVSDPSQVFSPLGGPSVQVFANPGGHIFHVLTLRRTSCFVHGRMTPGFSWFPGYAWRDAHCPGCGCFLGWRYVRVMGEGLSGFYGLIEERVLWS